MGSGHNQLAEIDETLDQLIANARALREIDNLSLFACEVEALQKKQELLLSRLLHRDTLQKMREGVQCQYEEGVQKKMNRFSKFHAKLKRFASKKKTKIRIPFARKVSAPKVLH